MGTSTNYYYHPTAEVVIELPIFVEQCILVNHHRRYLMVHLRGFGVLVAFLMVTSFTGAFAITLSLGRWVIVALLILQSVKLAFQLMVLA